jgi:hypothetical protein
MPPDPPKNLVPSTLAPPPPKKKFRKVSATDCACHFKWNAQFNLSQDYWLPATDYPRASRSFPRIAGSGNEIDIGAHGFRCP